MAAQGQGDMKVCPKCFETNEPTAEFCQDCGAPLVDGGEGSDQEVYKDLARANLLRMRGDMKAANDVCLSILRRYPNNPTAHGLLGDIAADQGDLAQAATWYEMALDLSPDSTADRQKLDSVQERIKLKESLATAQQIGLPEAPPRTTPFLILIGVIIVCVAIGAYVIGRSGTGANKEDSTIKTPVTFSPGESTSKTDTTDSDPVEEQAATTEPGPVTTTPGSSTDTAILNALQSKSASKVQYTGATEDPRGQSAVITVKSIDGEAPGLTATRAALEFYDLFPAYTKVTVRVVAAMGFSLVADMTQEAAKSAKAAIENGDSIENQSQVSLSQAWTPPHTAADTPEGAAK